MHERREDARSRQIVERLRSRHLISEKNGIYNEYRRAKDEYDELANVKYNAQRLMEAGQAQKHKKRSHEQER